MNAPVVRLQPAGGTLQQVQAFLGVTTPEGFSIPDDVEPRYFDTKGLQALMLERPPFYFVNRAVAIGPDTVWAVAEMTVERSAGHFPGRPIVPLIELCKAMAQAGMIVVAIGADQKDAPIAIQAGKSKALAKELMDAPVEILIRVTLTSSRLRLFFVDGMAYLKGQAIGSLANITYTLMDRDRLMGKAAA